jgi:hypothetical protein
MKNPNRHRDLSAEWLINRSHGAIHAVIPEGEKPEKRSGPVPYGDPDEARICLQCPYRECLLDDPDRYCRRYEKEMQKIRRQRKNDKTGEAR